MKEVIERGATSQITHVFIPDSASTTGAGKTGLTFNSATLKIVVMRPGEASATKYLQSASNIEDITTLGTYAAPTASKCRFKEIDATDLPGWYELQFADALFNATNSRRSLGGMISGATGVAPTPFQIQLADPVRGVASPTALPNAAAEASGGLATLSAAQASNGTINANVHRWLTGTPNALSSGRVEVLVGAVTAGVIAAASFAANALDAVWSTATRLLTAGTNIVLAKGVGVTGFTDLSAAQVNAEADTALADYDGPTSAELVSEINSVQLDIAGLTIPSVGQIADQVWDEAIAGHAGVGSTGEALDAAGSAGDPWITALPGAYGAGSAGKIVGDNLNATVSSRLASAGYTVPPTALENADALLKRDMSAVTGEAARSPLSAMRFNRNKFTIIAGVLTVYKEDDVTPAWTATITQTAGNPVSASDPS